MPSLALTVILVFDLAAVAGLLVVALVDPPVGPAQVGEATVGALGAGAVALAAAFHGGHLGLPRISTPGAAVAGTLGAAGYLLALARAARRRSDGGP